MPFSSHSRLHLLAFLITALLLYPEAIPLSADEVTNGTVRLVHGDLVYVEGLNVIRYVVKRWRCAWRRGLGWMDAWTMRSGKRLPRCEDSSSGIREFFLESANLFDFGEAFERRGGRAKARG